MESVSGMVASKGRFAGTVRFRGIMFDSACRAARVSVPAVLTAACPPLFRVACIALLSMAFVIRTSSPVCMREWRAWLRDTGLEGTVAVGLDGEQGVLFVSRP